MAKDFVIVKGKVVRMTDAAYKIASKHFGATKNRPMEKYTPVELLKMPKLPIIPAVKKIEKVELPEVKVLEPLPEPVKAEVVKEPVEDPVKVGAVKRTRRAK
jgi:hypothetical protein